MEQRLPDRIRDLVRNNQLSEAAELLSKSRLANEGIHQSSRLKALKQKIREGIVRADDEEIFENKIRKALLAAADEIENPGKFKRSNQIYLFTALFSLLALFMITLNVFNNDDIKSFCSNDIEKSFIKNTVAIGDFTLGNEKIFRGMLVSKLSAELIERDSSCVKTLGKFLEKGPTEKRILNNIDRGILVFGHIPEKGGLLCHIRLKNLSSPAIDLVINKDEVRITGSMLKIPDDIEFKIPQQAEEVGEFILGLIRYHALNPRAAISHLRRALAGVRIEIDPQYYRICNLVLGNSYQLLHQTDSAIARYIKVLELDPASIKPAIAASTYWNLGLAYVNENRGEDGLALLVKSAEFDPENYSKNEKEIMRAVQASLMENIGTRTILEQEKLIELNEGVNQIIDDPKGDVTKGEINNPSVEDPQSRGNQTLKPKFSSNIGPINSITKYFPKKDDKKDDRIFLPEPISFGKIDPSSQSTFSPDGRSVFSEGANFYKISDLSGRLILDSRSTPEIEVVSLSPSGKYILIGNKNGSFVLRDLSGKNLQIFNGHTKEVTSIVLSKSENFILTGSRDETAKLWDREGNLIMSFNHRGVVKSVAISPREKVIVTGGDQGAKIWNLRGKETAFLNHRSFVDSVGFAPLQNRIFTVGRGQTKVWNFSGKRIYSYKEKSTPSDKNKVLNWVNPRNWTKKDSASKIIIVDNQGNKLSSFPHIVDEIKYNAIMELSRRKPDEPINKNELIDEVVAGFFVPDNKHIITCTRNGLHVWDVSSGKKVISLWGGEFNSSTIMSPDSKNILSVASDGSMSMWDINSIMEKAHRNKE